MLLLRIGVLRAVGGVRLGAGRRLTEFYSSVHYPVQALLEGEHSHDRKRFLSLYPGVHHVGQWSEVTHRFQSGSGSLNTVEEVGGYRVHLRSDSSQPPCNRGGS
jgi:hypothetical protein